VSRPQRITFLDHPAIGLPVTVASLLFGVWRPRTVAS
jgi:hypothetical protein